MVIVYPGRPCRLGQNLTLLADRKCQLGIRADHSGAHLVCSAA